MIRNKTKRVALIALVLVAVTASIGTAAAATTTTTSTTNTTTTDTASTSTTNTAAPLNETVAADADARALYVSATNATGLLDVTVYSIVNGTESQVAVSTLNATANSTDSWEWSLPTDPADKYRVVVDGASVETVELYTIEKVAVGGGFMPSDGMVPFKTIILGGGSLLAGLGVVSYLYDGDLL